MVAIAALGLVVSIVGSIVAWQLVGDLDRGVRQSLVLTGDVLVTVDESFVIAEDSLAILDEGVSEAEAAVRALSASMADGDEALAAATELTGGEVADALESVEQSLPDIEAAADAIDDTLATLNSLPLGLSYQPDRPLAETIGELRQELAGLPDELREQAEQVERASEQLSAATEGTEATADSLAELQERLDAAAELVGDYALQTGEAADLVEEQRDVLANSASRARIMIVAFGLIFALGQFVPFHHGMALLGRPVTDPGTADGGTAADGTGGPGTGGHANADPGTGGHANADPGTGAGGAHPGSSADGTPDDRGTGEGSAGP